MVQASAPSARVVLGFRMAAGRAQPPRRQPRQARSLSTVEVILLAAARVFRREGWRATTNRIAAEAGVGVGSVYEYFPDKQALLHALAVKHLELAERVLAPCLAADPGEGAPSGAGAASLGDWLAAVQAAVLASQQYPSQALELLSGSARNELAARAAELRERVLLALRRRLEQRGHSPARARLRAQAAFGAIGELTVVSSLREGQELLAAELLAMALRHCEAPPDT